MEFSQAENQFNNERNPLLAHWQTVEDLIKEMGLPEDEEERRLNELLRLKQEFFTNPVNSEGEAEILYKIDKLLSKPDNQPVDNLSEFKPEADEILAEFQEAYRAIFKNYKSVGEALDKMTELKKLKQRFFACAAGSEEEKEIREEIRKIIKGESFGVRLDK